MERNVGTIRLRDLELGLRIAVTCLLLILAGGYAASFFQMVQHYRNKDENPSLSMADIEGSFHGVNQPSRLLSALKTSMRVHVPVQAEYDVLLGWLEGDRISEDYDSLELGDAAPAEIMAHRCMQCHSRAVAGTSPDMGTVPLEYWVDVKEMAFDKRLDPVPLDILVTSTHTHALVMPLVAVVVSLLFLAAGWPHPLARSVVALTFLALLADLGSWWLAREWTVFCYLLVGAGGAFALLSGLQIVGALLGTWVRLPTRD